MPSSVPSSVPSSRAVRGGELRVTTIESPVGALRLIAEGEQLVGLYFPGRGPDAAAQASDQRCDVLVRATAQLAEYFAGTRRSFDLPLALHGTAFQRRVWQMLLQLPYGATSSYGELARAIERPAAFRAVGAANGQNPISIIVPCHRLVGASGELTGYAGGLATKRWLLAHERAHAPSTT